MRSGIFKKKFRCSACRENPKLKEAWGCEERTKISAGALRETEDGVLYVYWNCPFKFIPQSVFGFFSLYDYYKDFPSAPMPKLEDVSLKFYRAYKYYENKLSEYMAEVK